MEKNNGSGFRESSRDRHWRWLELPMQRKGETQKGGMAEPREWVEGRSG